MQAQEATERGCWGRDPGERGGCELEEDEQRGSLSAGMQLMGLLHTYPCVGAGDPEISGPGPGHRSRPMASFRSPQREGTVFLCLF